MSKFLQKISIMLFLLGIPVLMSACSSTEIPPILTPDMPDLVFVTPTPSVDEPPQEMLTREAVVDSIELMLLESFPVQARLVVRGNYPDGCTELGQVNSVLDGNTFRVQVMTSRPADAICTEALVPFQHVISLDIEGLLAGDYLVDVNGMTTTFRLDVDNKIGEEAPGDFQINGLVWHDLCSVGGGEGGAAAVPSEGCISDGNNWYKADGIYQPQEPGLAGVEVQLGAGSCPSVGLATATTDSAGRYTFKVDQVGTYCVSIDANAAANSSILIPGEWTSPTGGEAAISVNLDASAPVRQDVNFGWDFQFLPEPEQTANCTNLVRFIADVTVPDDSLFSPGQVFEKTWRVRNVGTCTWTPGYAVVFASGNQMSGAASTNLTGAVSPNGEVDVNVRLTAPGSPGTYRSDWKLKDDKGTTFGAGSNATESFWVQIVVGEVEAGLNLGNPSWRDTMDTGQNWFLVNTANTLFQMKDGALLMTAYNPNNPEEWGLARPKVSDVYLEATFRTGKQCSGLDRYGLLFRAPQANEGYVLNVSCDGRFRLYTWDGKNFNALQNWTRSEAILSGPKQTNKIGVMADGNTIKLYANGKLISEIVDSKYKEGSFGLLIGSGETTNLEVYVEEVAYWDLD